MTLEEQLMAALEELKKAKAFGHRFFWVSRVAVLEERIAQLDNRRGR